MLLCSMLHDILLHVHNLFHDDSMYTIQSFLNVPCIIVDVHVTQPVIDKQQPRVAETDTATSANKVPEINSNAGAAEKQDSITDSDHENIVRSIKQMLMSEDRLKDSEHSMLNAIREAVFGTAPSTVKAILRAKRRPGSSQSSFSGQNLNSSETAAEEMLQNNSPEIVNLNLEYPLPEPIAEELSEEEVNNNRKYDLNKYAVCPDITVVPCTPPNSTVLSSKQSTLEFFHSKTCQAYQRNSFSMATVVEDSPIKMERCKSFIKFRRAPMSKFELAREYDSRTMTLFTLASHMTYESLVLGVDPSSLFHVFAQLNSPVFSKTSHGASQDSYFPHAPNLPIGKLSSLLLPGSLGVGKTENKLTQAKNLRKSNSLLEFPGQTARRLPTPPNHTGFHSVPPGPLSREQSGLSAVGSERAPSVSVDPPSRADSPEDGSREEEPRVGSALSDPASLPAVFRSTKTPDKLFQREDLSRASGRSKSSLRERRQVLSSLKASAEERRARSPSVYSIKSHRSVLSDAELDENGDMPFPPDETKEERETRLSLHDMATSPMPYIRDNTSDSSFSKKGIPMSEHPVVQEFIKTYNSVLQFKSGLSHAFSDRDMPSLSYILNEIEPVEFRAETRVQPQLEDMQKNVSSILEEVMVLLTNLISSERDYPVSSLLGITSKEPTRAALFTRETAQDRPKSRFTQPSAVSKASSTKEHLKELKDQYIDLQTQFDENKRNHEEQLNHNTVVMMEMQDTINALQRELSNIGQQAADVSDRQTDTIPEAPVMFTRLDSERNAKIMKRAVNEERLDPQKYEEALETMDKYTSLPAKRLTHLVQKYVHHVHMKGVEDNVRNQDNLDEEVFHILDKMEVLQNERAKRWADRMDEMGEQRQQLVGEMMMTLDDIEKESGVFLIKPMYSYKGNYNLNKYQGKLSRANRPVPKDRTLHSRAGSVYVPVPTPASNIRPSRSRQGNLQGDVTMGVQAPVSNPEDGVEGQMSTLVGEHPRPVWNPSISTGAQDPKRFVATLPGQINTPRILELDINRMLIGQNQVSQRIGQNLLTNDRLSNAANTTTRSYITVNRPSGQTTQNHSDRPRSHTGVSEAPPATPLLRETTPSKFDRSQTLGSSNTPPSGSHTPSGSYSAGSKRVRIHSDHVQSPRASPPAHAFSGTSPLPPIGSTEASQEISVSAVTSLCGSRSISDMT